MELTIIGAGAIGGTIGAHMVRAGHDVTFCDMDAAHVQAMNERGLTIEGPVENFTVPVRAITPDQLPDQIAHVAVAVKSHHTADVAALLQGRLAPGGWVVSWQNGLTADTLAEAVGTENLLVSFINIGADYLSPGRIMQGNVATFRVGEPFKNEITPRVRELVAALPYAEATDNVMGYLWGKEAYGAMLYAGAVSDLSIADHLSDPRYRELMKAVAAEVLAQAPVRPEGFDGFEPDDLDGSLDRLADFNRRSAKTHSGIYRDLMVRKRKTEVDDLLRDLHGPLTNHIGAIIQAIERGDRTCEVANLDLLATYERTLRVDPVLHAVVTQFLAPPRSLTGPLVGTQIAVKDMIDVAGHVRGNGNPHDQVTGTPAASDAPVVAALRSLGADIYVMTNLLEYAAGALHPDIPEAMNPYDQTKTAGGSSSGSAALVGAKACRIALGTDTGGSIRIPAHYCGVVGFKPSHGALSLEGVLPLSPTLDHVGFLADGVDITENVFAALTAGTPKRPATRLRVGVSPVHFASPVLTDDVRDGLGKALGVLTPHVDLVEVDVSALEALRDTFGPIVMFEAWQTHRDRVETKAESLGPETLRLFQAGATVTEASYQEALARRASLLPAVDALYREIDVLLTPSTPYVAPSTTPPMDSPEGDIESYFSSLSNLAGTPSIVLPIGLNANGLPMGIEASAAKGDDLALLACARLLEAYIGFVPNPVIR